jgi:hypothetical protein
MASGESEDSEREPSESEPSDSDFKESFMWPQVPLERICIWMRPS